MKKILALTMMCYAFTPASLQAEELFSVQEKDAMMQLTLEQFWGKAVDSSGKVIEPKDDEERVTLPVSREQAYYIIEKGGESGLAQWCGVAWDVRFDLLMQQMRNHLKTDTQVAYIGVLHGLAQKTMGGVMEDEACDRDTKKQMAALIKNDEQNLKKSLASE